MCCPLHPKPCVCCLSYRALPSNPSLISTLSLPPRSSTQLILELGSHTKSSVKIRVKQTIHHEGEVNRARYMPQNPDLIATKTVRGDVLVFDRTKHETRAPEGMGCRPDIRLKGQTKEG